MKRGHKIGIAVLLLAGVLATAALLSPNDEPAYQGQSLSRWIYLYRTDLDRRRETRQAIQHIGTNALPTLLRWISYDPPRWRVYLAAWSARHLQQHFYYPILGARGRQASFAITGFRALGTTAYPAIPDLQSLFRSKSAFVSGNARYVLLGLGTAQYVVAVQALTSSDATVRANAAFYFGNFFAPYMTQGIAIESQQEIDWPYVTNSLAHALQDESPDVRIEASNALSRIASHAVSTRID